MVNDLLSDMVARINNAYAAGHKETVVINSKLVTAAVKALTECGYLSGAESQGRKLLIQLKYEGKKPAVMGMKRISKPGARIYTGWKDLPRVWGGLGTHILSTPTGVMAGKDIRKRKTGGELLIQVW